VNIFFLTNVGETPGGRKIMGYINPNGSENIEINKFIGLFTINLYCSKFVEVLLQYEIGIV